MSGGSQTVDSAALLKQIEAIEHDTSELINVLKRIRTTRLIMLLGVVILIALVCFMFWRLADQFRQKEYLDTLTTTLNERMRDPANKRQVAAEFEALWEHTQPQLTKAFKERVDEDKPKIEQLLEDEGNLLFKNIQTKLMDKFEKEHQEVLDKHEEVLRSEFPRFQDKKLHAKMIANMQTAMEQLMSKYYFHQVKAELEAMLKTFENFPVADPTLPIEQGGVPIEDQIIGDLIDLVAIKLSGLDNAGAEDEGP